MSDLNLTPIQLLPARERVASVLRKAILSKELSEGEEITLEGIGKKLGVSNTPVREAFQILAQEDLIKLRPNKGAIVLGVTAKTIQDHYETRAILEGAAAETICKNGANLDKIINAHEQSKIALQQGDSAQYTNYNQSFHMEIWIAAGNIKIKSILSQLWNGLSMGHKDTEEGYAKISIAEHETIVQALMERNAERAKQAMQNHIERSKNNILTHFQ